MPENRVVRKLTAAEMGRPDAASLALMEKRALVVVLDNLRSGHNTGAIFRSADSFLVQEIQVCGITPLPDQREVQKSALGATVTVPWKYVRETALALKALKTAGWHITGVEQTNRSTALGPSFTPPQQPVALVFGNEVRGLSEDVLPLCDDFVEIPQHGSKHSLNVAVCAGIVLWEYCRGSR
jgi:tRNA G18 (ribose-2'-O)-methylase SpoU